MGYLFYLVLFSQSSHFLNILFSKHLLGVISYSFLSESAAMKIIYLRIAELNEKWSNRVIKGYYKCKDEIMDMFRERYP